MSSAARILLAGVALLVLAAACTHAPAPDGANPRWESAAPPSNSVAAEGRKAADGWPAERAFVRETYAAPPASGPAIGPVALALRAVPTWAERRTVLLRSARRRN